MRCIRIRCRGMGQLAMMAQMSCMEGPVVML